MRKMLFDQIQMRGSIKTAVAACLLSNGRSVGAMAFLLLGVLATMFAADTHAQANTPATGEPTISGAPQVGEMLTVDTSAIDDADGLGAFSYQWIRVDGGAETQITGATSSSYTLTDDDLGNKVKIKVSFTDDEGNAEEATSDAWPSSGLIVAVSTLVLQRRFNAPLRESFVAQGLMGQLPDVHLRRKWASGKRRISNASL